MENLNKLMSVMTALNNIEVKGRQNLVNLSGCIALVDEVCKSLSAEKKFETKNGDNDKNKA